MGKNNKQRSLEETPSWAVSVVCFNLILLSLLIEYGLHLLTKFLNRRKRSSLNQAMGKIKIDLMTMGFMSLVLTASEVPVSRICVSKAIGNSFLPCNDPPDSLEYTASVAKQSSGSNTTLSTEDGYSCEAKGMITLMSRDGIMQLRIFIFVLAAFHVLYCVLTMCLGIAKMRRWERWEEETQTLEYEIENGTLADDNLKSFVTLIQGSCSNTMVKISMASYGSQQPLADPSYLPIKFLFMKLSLQIHIHNPCFLQISLWTDPRRFRFMRQTSFGRRHLKFWSDHPLLLWPACFLRQFSGSVTKADYCTLRNGFIVAHFSKSRDFNFQMFLARVFDSDFVQVVGISLWVWIFSIFFIFFSAQGFYNHFWLPFIPLVMVLIVGTNLEVIITKMCLESPNKTAVVHGSFLVRPNDDLFWFGKPQWLLYVIHFILFQNSFQLAFFTWTWYEFGLKSCFHREMKDITLRIVTGVTVQFLCGYVTLPLYALVTQMGSGMKSAVFTERVAKGLKQWHNLARQHLSKNKPISTKQSSEPWPTDTTEKSLSDMQELGFSKHDHPPPLPVTSSVTLKSSDTTEKSLSDMQELGSPKIDRPPPLSLTSSVIPKSTDEAVKNKVITREAYGEISFGSSWKKPGSGKTINDITSVLDEVSDVN